MALLDGDREPPVRVGLRALDQAGEEELADALALPRGDDDDRQLGRRVVDAGAERVDELAELAGRDPLAGRADYVGRVQRAGDRRHARRPGRTGDRMRSAATEEDGDAAVLHAVAEVDVRLRRGRRQPA